ncbi:MAG: Imm39 family immunity protein [Caulobacter sp.]|nr:Imm39 family immunity protein [Caulobacter sp.]
MAHNRKLVLSGVALTKARIPPRPNALAASRVRDELEREIIDSQYLEGAPFRWVGLIIRYGLKDETEPHYEAINDKDGDLPLAIEVDVHRLLDVSEDEMATVYRKATLSALVHAGERYQRPVERLRALLEAA